MKARPMTNSHSSTFLNPRSNADSAARADRELNAAIVSADISASYEEFLAIVDQFYADNVELRSDPSPELLIGRDRLKSLLVDFLVPLHVMAEIGGLSVTLQYKPILSDCPPTSRHRTFVLNTRPGRPRDFSERFSLCGMRN